MDINENYFGTPANEIFDYVNGLCNEAGFSEQVAYNFITEIKKDKAALEEFVYYYKNEAFLCKYKIGDYTLADIMIWQMDHFRAHMDRLDNINRYNRGSLILSTFSAFIIGNKNPQELIARISSETGTDLTSGWTTR